MSGRGFVVLLAFAAVTAAVAIALGVPTDVVEGPEAAGDAVPYESRSAAEIERGAKPSSLPSAVDSTSTTSADTAASWGYRRTTVADLDGDGVPERLVLTSDVFLTDDGEPVWEDRQRWAVFVEEDDRTRTLLYAGWAAPGAVSAAVSRVQTPSLEGVDSRKTGRTIVVIEQDTRRARLMILAYDGPGRRRFLDAAGTQLDAWVDRVAEEAR
jgi:hypothetical protein